MTCIPENEGSDLDSIDDTATVRDWGTPCELDTARDQVRAAATAALLELIPEYKKAAGNPEMGWGRECAHILTRLAGL
jgi:hypothetical protein